MNDFRWQLISSVNVIDIHLNSLIVLYRNTTRLKSVQHELPKIRFFSEV